MQKLVTIFFVVITLALSTAKLFAATDECKGQHQALVVRGALSEYFFADKAFANATNELVLDLEERGYQVFLLIEPSKKTFKEFLKDPCVRAFGFVGHTVDEDSATPNIEDSGANEASDYLFIRDEAVVVANDVKKIVKDREFDLVILHACHAGAPNNRQRWMKAFNVESKNFYTWKKAARAIDVYRWQFFFQ